MKKELKVHMDFYLTMNNNETEEQAIERFFELMKTLDDGHEGAFQVYDFEEQEV